MLPMYDNRFKFGEVTLGMGLNKRDVEVLGSKIHSALTCS